MYFVRDLYGMHDLYAIVGMMCVMCIIYVHMPDHTYTWKHVACHRAIGRCPTIMPLECTPPSPSSPPPTVPSSYSSSPLSVLLPRQAELEERKKNWTPPPLPATKGTLFKYIKNVASAAEGCVTDE